MQCVAKYSLHIAESGVELRFDGERPLRFEPRPWMQVIDIYRIGLLLVHHVYVFEGDDGGLFEQTHITSIETGPGKLEDGTLYAGRIIHPKPHGRGWLLHNDSSDNYQSFRRP